MYGIIKKEDDFSAPIGVNISAQKMLTHGDGKTEDPSIGFNSDPTTGWYINAEGEVVFTTYGRDNIIQGYYHTEFKKPIVLASVNNIDDDDILSEGNGYLYKKYNNDGLFWKTKNKEIDLSKIADVVDYKTQSNEIINNEIKKFTNKVIAAESDIINKILDKIPGKITGTIKDIVSRELQTTINQEVYKNALLESSDKVLDELSNQLPIILTGVLPNTLPDILPQILSDILPQMIDNYRIADLDMINTIKAQVNNNSIGIKHNITVMGNIDHLVNSYNTKLASVENKLIDVISKSTNTDSKLTNTDSKITVVNTKLTDIYGKLVIDENKLINLNTEIANFKSELAGIYEKIDNKITRMSGGIGAKINDLLNKTNELRDKTNELHDKTNDLAQNTENKIAALSNKTNELHDKTNELRDKTNDLAQNTENKIAALSNKTNELHDKTNDLAQNTENKLNNVHDLISANDVLYNTIFSDLSENINCMKLDVEQKTKSCTDLINNIIDTYTNLGNKVVGLGNQYTVLNDKVVGLGNQYVNLDLSMNAICDKSETMSIDIEYVRNLCNKSIENNNSINETIQLLLKKATSQCFTLDRLSLEVDDLKIEMAEQNDKYSELRDKYSELCNTTNADKCPENPSNILTVHEFKYAIQSTLKHGDLVCLNDGYAVKALGGRWKKIDQIKNSRVILVQNNKECDILLDKTSKIKIINVISVNSESDNKIGDESDNKTVDESDNKTVDESDNKTVDESDNKTVNERAYLITYVNEQDNLCMGTTNVNILTYDNKTLEIDDDLVTNENNGNKSVCILENISNANIGSFCIAYDHSNNIIIVLFYNNLSNNYSLFLFLNTGEQILKGIELNDILTDTVVETAVNMYLTVLPGQIILVNHGCRKFAVAITTYDSIISVGDIYIDYESNECCNSVYDANNGYVITVEKTMTAVCFIQTLDILGTKIQKINDKKIRHADDITPINLIYDTIASHYLLLYSDNTCYCVQRIDINDDITIGLKFYLPSDSLNETKNLSSGDNKATVVCNQHKSRLYLSGCSLFLAELDGNVYCFENLYKQYPASFIGIANNIETIENTTCSVCIKGQIFTSKIAIPKSLVGKKVYLSDTNRDFPYNLSSNNTGGVFIGTCISDDSIVVGL